MNYIKKGYFFGTLIKSIFLNDSKLGYELIKNIDPHENIISELGTARVPRRMIGKSFLSQLESPIPNITLNEALEMIDIGGPTMIRAAAKNIQDVVVVPNPKYYNQIIKEIRENNGIITDKTRALLAQEVFVIMANYNAEIANYLQNYYYPNIKLNNNLIKTYKKVQDCRYGENWDQKAAYYRDNSAKYGLHSLNQLSGKEISFNNYLDIDTCMQMLLDFNKDHHVTTILKHTSPNGIAIDNNDQMKSVQMAFSCDPLSAFGGIWGVNQKLSTEVADFIVNKKKIFIEVLMAPSYEPEALEILKTNSEKVLGSIYAISFIIFI